MDARKKTRAVLSRHIQASERARLEAQMKTAGVEDPDVRLAGEVPKPPKVGAIDNEVAGHVKRAIPKDYDYDPRALKPLAQMLWALSVSLGHAMTAHRQFVKLKSATISPDGLVGGRGYVMSVKDIRKALHDACEAISAVSDTIHDELHAPHWQPKLAELEKNDIESVERLVGDAERIMDDPEGTTSDDDPEDMEKAEESGPRADLGGEEESASEMPDGDDLADNRPDNSSPNMKQKMASEQYGYRRANSSLPVEMLPGPRVEHLDRGDVDQTGPFGSYNSEEPQSMADSWSRNDGGRSPGEYDYESEWDNDLSEKTAAEKAADPGYVVITAKTVEDLAHQFHRDLNGPQDFHDKVVAAHEKTMFYRGLAERIAERFSTSMVATGDNAITIEAVLAGTYPGKNFKSTLTHAVRNGSALCGKVQDDSLAGEGSTKDGFPSCKICARRIAERFATSMVPDSNLDPTPTQGYDFGIGMGNGNDAHGQGAGGYGNVDDDGKGVFSPSSELPKDPAGKLHDQEMSDTTPSVEQAVGRSSMPRTATAKLPNDGQPPVARSDYYEGDKGNVVNSNSTMPGEPVVDNEFARDVQPGVGYSVEPGNQPYIKWDSTTRNMRPDYVYQREVQGPYVKG